MNDWEILWGEVAPVFITAAATVIGGAIAGLATWLTVRIQHRGKPENALIDQLQEQIKERDEFWKQQIESIKATAEEAKETSKEAKTTAERAERRERILMDYVSALRRQIEQGDPPPPIAWPNLD